MTSHDAEPSARHRGHEARLLADSLRTSRVTLLYGEAGSSGSGLLTDGVLPLLRRRAGDGPTPAGRRARAAVPEKERRNAGEGRRRRSERVVLFNDWAGAPLAALEVAILSSLPMGVVVQAEHHRLSDLLAELCDRLDARFLLVFDAVEQLWGADSRADAILDFVEQLSEAANRADLSANFLLSIDESAASRLDAFRRRITGFDDSTLWLHAVTPKPTTRPVDDAPETEAPLLRAASLPVLALADAVPAAPRPERVRRKRPPRQPLPPSAPIKTETVYAFIESTLTQTGQTAHAAEPWQETAEAAAVVARGGPVSGEVARSPSRPGPRAEPRRPPSARQTPPTLLRPDDLEPPLAEPPSPIDQWLDAVILWGRRVLRLR